MAVLVDKLKIGSSTPSMLKIKDYGNHNYRTTWDDGSWVINDGWEVEVLSPTKLAIKKFTIDTWGLRHSFMQQWRIKVFNIEAITDIIDFVPAYIGGGWNYTWSAGQYTSGNSVRGVTIFGGNETLPYYQMVYHSWDFGTYYGLESTYYSRWSEAGGRYPYTYLGIFGGHQKEADGELNIQYDISNNPLIINILPSDAEYFPYKHEIWKAYKGSTLIYDKEKTVADCLGKYYGTITDGIIKLTNINPQVIIDNVSSYYVLPDPSILVDLDNYNTATLRLESSQHKNTNAYVDWFNKKCQEYLSDPDIFNELVSGFNWSKYFGNVKIYNTENTPITIVVPMSSDYGGGSSYFQLDGFLYNAYIGYLKIIIKQFGDSPAAFSTAFRSFQGFNCRNLEIEHQDKDGNVITPYEANCGFMPAQLNATFSGSGFSILKREWMGWQRVQNMIYAFDNNGTINEIQSNGEEVVLYPHNMRIGEGNYKWPYFYTVDSEGNITDTTPRNEQYYLTQAFNNCGSLRIIEPILNVTYLANPGNIYNVFGNAKSITYLRLKGLNNFDWDFTAYNLNLPNLDEDSVQYLLDNVVDQTVNPYTESNVDTKNVSSDYPDVYFDHINYKSSRSLNNLKIILNNKWLGVPTLTGFNWNKGSISDNVITITSRVAGATLGSSQGDDVCNKQSVTISNLIIYVTGLTTGDKLRIGDDNGNLVFYEIINNGYYLIESFIPSTELIVKSINTAGTTSLDKVITSATNVSGWFAIGLVGDTTITSTVTIKLIGYMNHETLIGNNTYKCKIAQETITALSNKGWYVDNYADIYPSDWFDV